MDEEYNKIVDILVKNSKKPFVQRILYKDQYPVLKNKDGSYSSHSMAWANTDNGAIVYPTVVESGDGGMVRLNGNEAIERAIKEKDYIEFDNPKEADFFSKRYKIIWDE